MLNRHYLLRVPLPCVIFPLLRVYLVTSREITALFCLIGPVLWNFLYKIIDLTWKGCERFSGEPPCEVRFSCWRRKICTFPLLWFKVCELYGAPYWTEKELVHLLQQTSRGWSRGCGWTSGKLSRCPSSRTWYNRESSAYPGTSWRPGGTRTNCGPSLMEGFEIWRQSAATKWNKL